MGERLSKYLLALQEALRAVAAPRDRGGASLPPRLLLASGGSGGGGELYLAFPSRAHQAAPVPHRCPTDGD